LPEFSLLFIPEYIFELLRFSQIFELLYPFKGTIINIYTVTLSCILTPTRTWIRNPILLLPGH